MAAGKIRALTEQLIRSETPEMAVAVSAHLQGCIREFIEELRSQIELLPLLQEPPLAPEHNSKPN